MQETISNSSFWTGNILTPETFIQVESDVHPYIAYFWETITLEFMLKFFVVYFFAIWIALVLWVARDISNRSESLVFQIFCVILIIVLTPLGIFLYLLLRPRKTVFEKYYQEVENNLAILSEIVEERIEGWVILSCPSCQSEVDKEFIICPDCHTTLKHECYYCKKEIRQNWTVCPYCQTKQKKSKILVGENVEKKEENIPVHKSEIQERKLTRKEKKQKYKK